MTLRDAILEAQKVPGSAIRFPGQRTVGEDVLCDVDFDIVEVMTDCWTVVKPTPPPMDFATAMRHLQEGRKVRRRAWGNQSIQVSSALTGLPISYGNIEATDWEVLPE